MSQTTTANLSVALVVWTVNMTAEKVILPSPQAQYLARVLAFGSRISTQVWAVACLGGADTLMSIKSFAILHLNFEVEGAIALLFAECDRRENQ
ncbi:MAG: hypothetical protein RMX63_34545 [Aulosira sp. ZfuCHP01]|nr:hypothetical protein [Aulosira sp. ZfuVER01]MDZ8002346.1 hypothetical protein [Aulosira sp. DedVER01a]MDZ8056546.1 hypothetical protein [Aulosira sp. ZfuCHP01]